MCTQLTSRQVRQLKQDVFKAAKDGNADYIKHLLSQQSPDLITEVLHHQTLRRNIKGTPLTIAAENGHLEVVQLLVEHFHVQCDQRTVSRRISDDATALMCAAFHGFLDIVKCLVSNGSYVNQRNKYEETSVYYASYGNHLEVVKYLVESGAETDEGNVYGQSCLMAACERGNEEMVLYLLDKGADINKKDEDDRTPLHMAAVGNASQVLELLLKNEANISKDQDGHSPLTLAAQYHSADVVRFFVESSYATGEEKIDALELLGARLAATDMEEGFTYLRQAMIERYKDPSNIISKPHSPLPTLSGAVESRTLEELEARHLDPDTLRLECLAIVHRLLACNISYVWQEFVIYCMKLNSVGRHNEALDILLYATKTAQERERPCDLSYLRYFLYTFGDLLQNGELPPFTAILEVMQLILTEMQRKDTACLCLPIWNDSLVNFFLQCIMIGLNVARCQEEGRLLKEKTECLISLRPSISHGRSVLHETVISYWNRSWELNKVQDLRLDLLVSFLIQCGADVNAMDNRRSRPLHNVAGLSPREEDSDTLCRITQTLVEAGALVGVKNSQGKTPLDVAATEVVAAILREHCPVSLKSLAASAVVRHQIPYAGEIPEDLEEFVQRH